MKDTDKEVFRNQIWLVAEASGVQVLTYALLDNHFHLLVRVPKLEPISDEELLRRYRLLFPNPTKAQSARITTISALVKAGGTAAENW